MGELITAFQSVFTIVLLVFIGYVLQAKGKITNTIGSFLSFFVVNITLPCSVFKTVTTSLGSDELKNIPLYVTVIIISQILSMLLAWGIANVFKISEEKKGSFIALTAFNNTLFMGMPVSIALFGETNASIILYYYVASTILFWSVGIRVIAGKKINGKFKLPTPLYGLILGIVFVLIREVYPSFGFPDFANDTIKYIAGMTTPLSMIFTGFALGQFGLKNIRFDKSVCLGLVARFIVSPLVFIAGIMVLNVDTLARNVFIVQAFMPVMASQTVIARQYGVDDKYPAVMVAISTLLSLVIIPIVKVVIS